MRDSLSKTQQQWDYVQSKGDLVAGFRQMSDTEMFCARNSQKSSRKAKDVMTKNTAYTLQKKNQRIEVI